jgi:alkylhydroperoxidase family enzyme
MRALGDYRDSDEFSEIEKLVIAYAEAMSRSPVDVPDDLFDRLKSHFDDAQIVELTAAIAWENYRGRFNHALLLEPQYFSSGAFCVVPERHSTSSK